MCCVRYERLHDVLGYFVGAGIETFLHQNRSWSTAVRILVLKRVLDNPYFLSVGLDPSTLQVRTSPPIVDASSEQGWSRGKSLVPRKTYRLSCDWAALASGPISHRGQKTQISVVGNSLTRDQRRQQSDRKRFFSRSARA
jgi:hypothetical protein